MQTTFLIKGGTVVDGTGAPAYAADVRVKQGAIAEIGRDLGRHERERVIDASGCYVTPGFIESHNHFDGPMWWMPAMEPMPGYGVTTSINGNCGFTAAPVHDDPKVRQEMVDIFSFFEDIPNEPFMKLLPWDWKTWSEYRSSLMRNVKLPVNFASYCGHIAMRLAVMGLDAWERAATPEEVVKMCDLLEDALNAGALGMSSNLLDNDSKNRPIPSKQADDAEWGALMDVIARHPGATLQVIVDYFMRLDAPQSVERIAALAGPRGVRVQIAGGVPTLAYQDRHVPEAQARFERIKSEGGDIWMGYHHVAPTVLIGFISSLSFAQSNNYVWHEIIEAKAEDEKIKLLSDPQWRARARVSYDSINPHSRNKPEHTELFDSETGAGPTGLTLQEFAESRGQHPSDALADWILDNGVNSNLRLKDIPKHEPATMALFKDKMSVGNLSDSGAHGKMFCGIGDNVLLLTKYVRDDKSLTIEEGVHILTGKLANHFHLHDRGEIAVGKQADIVVFNLDEIERRSEFKTYDVPDGEGGRTFRYTRDPAPMRLTMVNGATTFDRGAFTGNFPGHYIGPALAPAQMLQAAE